MALENYPKVADYQIARTGVLGEYRYILGTDCVGEINLDFIVFYFLENDATPTLVATLSTLDQGDLFQQFSLYTNAHVHFEILPPPLSIDGFLEHVHPIAEKILTKSNVEWHPPLQHYPILASSTLLDYGTVKEYQYEFHHSCTSTEFVDYMYLLYCYVPQKRVPSLVLYVEHNQGGNSNTQGSTPETSDLESSQLENTRSDIQSERFLIGSFESQNHNTEPLRTALRSHKEYLEHLLDLAKQRLSAPIPQPEEKDALLSFPVLELSEKEIKKVLHIETLYELSLLSTILLLVGHVFSTMDQLPYFGWLFYSVWFLSWLLSALLAFVVQKELIPPLWLRIPAATLLFLPFFFTYGPTVYLILLCTMPIMLFQKLKSFGLQVEIGGISKEDSELLKLRLQHFSED